MRLTRIHVPGALAVGAQVALPAQAALHLTRVLRLEPGAALTVFNGLGGEYSATLGALDGKQVLAHVTAQDAVERESPLRVTLLQGIARGERMDLIVQKATELGVARIVPVMTERSVVRLDAQQRARKREHWQAVAIAACEQCGRNRVPEVAMPASLADAIAALPAAGLRCLLAIDAQAALASVARSQRGDVALLIGPEGGLADAEQAHARGQGFTPCLLGPRILRTETAGPTALAVLQTVAGDLDAPAGAAARG